jgi:hypothetical protein
MKAMSLGAASVAAWLVAVAVIAIVRAVDPGGVSVYALASSPDALTSGRVWTLVTSGFVVAGPPLPQLVMTAIVAVAVVRLAGPAMWWLSAIAGHFGATFIAYAGIAAVSAVEPATAEGVIHAPDYGISAVWAATTGTLLLLLHRAGAHPRLTAVCTFALLGAFITLVGVDGELADVEHLLAFVIGLAVVAVRSPSGRLATLAA